MHLKFKNRYLHIAFITLFDDGRPQSIKTCDVKWMRNQIELHHTLQFSFSFSLAFRMQQWRADYINCGNLNNSIVDKCREAGGEINVLYIENILDTWVLKLTQVRESLRLACGRWHRYWYWKFALQCCPEVSLRVSYNRLRLLHIN